MSPTVEVVASGVFGVAAGLLAGFFGIGGGAILPPLFVFVLGLEQHRAQGISLAAQLPPVGLPAVLAYRRSGIAIDAAFVAFLVVGFLFGSFGGAWLAHRLPARELRWFFAAFLLLSAWRAAVSPRDATTADGAGPRPSPWRAVPIGLAAGVMGGLLGLGGGLIALPLLRRFAKLGRLEAQATTLAMMLPPIGLPAVYVYAREQGGLPWALLGAVGVGFAVGSGMGARLAARVDGKRATMVYAAFLGGLAVLVLARGG